MGIKSELAEALVQDMIYGKPKIVKDKFVTVVIKYEGGQQQPSFHADMKVLGGTVTAVMFDDALEKLEEVENELQIHYVNGYKG